MPYWRLFSHLVWATKNREPVIRTVDEASIAQTIRMTSADLDLTVRAIGFMPDHVHVIVDIPPKIALAEAVKRLKGASSHAVNELPDRKALGARFAWHAE